MLKIHRDKFVRLVKITAIVIGIGISSTGSTQSGRNSLNDDFNAAFFITWLATLFNLIIFPTYLIVHKIAKLEPPINSIEFKENIKKLYFSKKKQQPSLALFFGITLFFSFIWMVANYSFTKALNFILPSDNTAIYASSNVFVFILSVLILKENFYFTKLLAVAIATIGVVLFAYSEGFSMSHAIGIILSLVSAISASFYKVLYKKLIKFGSVAQVSFTMTMIGVFDALLYWPFILVMHFTGFETIPSTDLIPFLPIFGRGSFALVFNFLINFGIAYVSAVVISIGSLLSLPFNTLYDLLVRGQSFNAIKLGGSILIIFSFLLLLIPNDMLSKYEKRYLCNRITDENNTLPKNPDSFYPEQINLANLKSNVNF